MLTNVQNNELMLCFWQILPRSGLGCRSLQWTVKGLHGNRSFCCHCRWVGWNLIFNRIMQDIDKVEQTFERGAGTKECVVYATHWTGHFVQVVIIRLSRGYSMNFYCNCTVHLTTIITRLSHVNGAEMCLFAVKLVPPKQQYLDEILHIIYSSVRNMKV